MELRDDKKAMVQFFKLLFYLLIFFHGTACMWWYIVTFDDKWIPPKDMYLAHTDLYERPFVFQYFICFYYAIMIVGSNELNPTSVLQKWYLALMMLIGNLILANIVGEMFLLMSVITRRSSAFFDKLDVANYLMHTIHITESTQEEIREFFFQTRETLEEQRELNTFLGLISPSLRSKVSWHIFIDELSRNQMIKLLEENPKTLKIGDIG